MAITDSILTALNTGNSVLKLLPYTPGTGANLASLNFTSADEIFTLEDSFQISKDAASFSATKIDQKHRVIEREFSVGENYTMVGNIPSIATALLDIAFEAGSAVAVSAVNGDKTYSSTKAYKLTPKVEEYSVLCVSQNGNTAVVFGRVRFIFSEPQHDDNTNATYIHFDAVILPNEHASGDWAPLPTVANTSGSGNA